MIPGYSLIDPNKPRSRRFIVALDAIEKHGKTRFALTAPGPIGYMDFDQRSEGTIEEFLRAGKPIAWRTDKQGHPWPYKIPTEKSKSDIQALAKAEWFRFENDFEQLLHAQAVRTIVVDLASEAWELLRLAAFGKLAQIPPHLYTEANGVYRRLIRLVREQSRVNLILIHRLKDEWANEKKSDGSIKGYTTGKKERAGFAETGFLADVNLRLYRLPQHQCEVSDLGFRLEVVDCGANAKMRGMILENEMIDFAVLASMITEGETSPEEWR